MTELLLSVMVTETTSASSSMLSVIGSRIGKLLVDKACRLAVARYRERLCPRFASESFSCRIWYAIKTAANSNAISVSGNSNENTSRLCKSQFNVFPVSFRSRLKSILICQCFVAHALDMITVRWLSCASFCYASIILLIWQLD